jgi:two-component system NtrC family sensor kinase
LYIHFFHAFLGIDTRRWLVTSAYGGAVVLAAMAPSELIIASSHRFPFGFFGQAGPAYIVMAAGAASATVYNLWLVYGALRNEKRTIEKNKLQYVFLGFGTLGLLSSLNILPMYGVAVYPPGAFGFLPMTVFAAGVFKYDLLGLDMLIRKSVLYSLLMGALTAIYALVVIGVQSIFAEMRWADSLFFPVALFILITFLFGPLKSRIQVVVDAAFDKGRYEYRQTIKQASQTIASALDYPAISQLMQKTLVNGMRVGNCTLFVRDPQADRYVALAKAGESFKHAPPALAIDARISHYFHRNPGPIRKQQLMGNIANATCHAVLTEMEWLHAELVLPMRFKAEINGLLVLGEKRSGYLYTNEDLDLLETLCHQSALAIENARAYNALDELNRSLESKVVARTADLQNALEEKERTQEQLIRSESLAALGQLVAGVAHELNNPLASVTSLLQSTVEDLQAWDANAPPDEDLIDDLHFADKELARAKSIVASLLGLARQTQTYAEQVDLNAVVRDALRILHNQYKHASLTLVEALAPELPSVQGNFANLGQVVLNIIKNAIQAVAGRTGRIELTTEFISNQNDVIFQCRDNGPGIDPMLRQDVFKPFFTTKPVGQGTGLGLYISHEIVRRHNGTISIESDVTSGTCLTVRLPVTK